MFFKVSQRDSLENRLQNLNKVADFSQKNVQKIIEHVSYSIRHCKISLLAYSGSSEPSNAVGFFYSPGRM